MNIDEHCKQNCSIVLGAEKPTACSAQKSHLLGVTGAREFGKVGVGVDSAQEDGLELVHAGVSKQQCGVVVGHHTAGRHRCVALRLKELHKCRPHPVT